MTSDEYMVLSKELNAELTALRSEVQGNISLKPSWQHLVALLTYFSPRQLESEKSRIRASGGVGKVRTERGIGVAVG